MDVYRTCVHPLVEEAVTRSQTLGVLALGENQSGKSYTVFGVENLQQEEFSIDQEDVKDTRGVVMKTIHCLLKRAKSEGKNVGIEAQCIDLYLDTIRDLTRGKGRTLTLERELEIEERDNGEVRINNAQTVKINHTKDAAALIEKCVSYHLFIFAIVRLSEETRAG